MQFLISYMLVFFILVALIILQPILFPLVYLVIKGIITFGRLLFRMPRKKKSKKVKKQGKSNIKEVLNNNDNEIEVEI